MKQLPLFDLPTPPSRPFVRYSRKLDEVRICSHCGRQIIARRRGIHDELVEEYVSPDNACWHCVHPVDNR
jgi:hypothetical protein